MRIEQLKYLVEIAKTHSITVAAENLHVTQPTISEAIKKLEQELNVNLFSRSKTGVHPTNIGREILQAAIIITEQVEKITGISHNYNYQGNTVLGGNLSISMLPSVSNSIMPTMLPEFTANYPNIKLSLLERNSSDIIQVVQSQQCDLGIFHTIEEKPPVQVKPPLELQHLFSEKIYIIVSKHSNLAHKKSLSMKEACQYPISLLSYHPQDNILDSLYDNGINPNIVLKTNNRSLVRMQVAEGNSISILVNSSMNSMDLLSKDIVAIPVSDSIHLKVFCVYNQQNPQLDLIRLFIAKLKDYC